MAHSAWNTAKVDTFYPQCLEKQRTKTLSWNVFKNFIIAEPSRLQIESVNDILLKMI